MLLVKVFYYYFFGPSLELLVKSYDSLGFVFCHSIGHMTRPGLEVLGSLS